MTKKAILRICAFLIATPVAAQTAETGLATIHDWRNEAGRVCMSAHSHDGSGNGQTRKAAEASAVASWSSFTVFEYGRAWGNYALSGSKKMACNQGGKAQFSCDVTARPCKRR